MEAETLESEVKSVVAQGQKWEIVDGATYSQAGELWNAAKELRAKVAARFDPIIKKAHAAHKEAVAQKAAEDDPLERIQRVLKSKMIIWDSEQERIRQREQARLAAEARAKEEADREELQRLLKAAGEEEAAEEVAAQPVEMPTIILAKETPKVEGFKYRSNWTFEVTDESKIPREYLIVDRVKIAGVVRAMKQATNIPGIKVIEEKV